MSSARKGATPQILVVDDTPENLQVVGEMLSRQLSCDLSFATDGRQALESVKESPPDLILLDVMMPGMTGYEVCRALKADPATAEIPVLFLTAKVESADLVEGFDAGAVDYIAKPFNPPELIARVRTQLKIRQAEAERLEFEAQERQLQKAESLGRMAGAIAHNFNNQLQTVLGNLEIALEDLPRGTGTAEILEAALKAGNRAAEMSGLMLTYLGQTTGKPEPMDLSAVCRFGLSALEAELPETVELKIDFPSAGPVLRATAGQIQQVLGNLLANAREAIGERPGSIRVSIRSISSAEIPEQGRVPLAWRPQGARHACLEVADTGGGIAGADIDKIFDPFFTTKFTGRGLGLSVVLGIVRAHGGAIAVESAAGRGSVFRVFLPILSEAVAAPAAKAAPAPETAVGGTVLLVEAEPDVRRLAAAMLTRIGFGVREASDGMAALEVLRRHPGEIRCVVCDLTMPQMDGWETLAALRQLAPGLPAILASGYDQSQAMAGKHAEWPQAFLHKPYQLAKLREALRLAIEKPPDAGPPP